MQMQIHLLLSFNAVDFYSKKKRPVNPDIGTGDSQNNNTSVDIFLIQSLYVVRSIYKALFNLVSKYFLQANKEPTYFHFPAKKLLSRFFLISYFIHNNILSKNNKT